MHLPKEYQKKMQRLLGEDYENYLGSFDKKYGQTFRINQLKTIPAEFLRRFAVKPGPWCGQGFYYEGQERLSLLPYYYGGAYYIQEPSAMAPASFLPVRPGDRVLDLCAAPGGKTTALAARMQGEGILIANDISISRCKALLKNMEMAGVGNAVITCESPEKLSGRFVGYFDAVLVDAPCSGEGMFRKDPSMAENWSEEEVNRYAALQKDILKEAAKMVRPGGHLLYSTCTYSPEEDEQIVETLLRTDNTFSLMELPLYDGVDQGHPEWSVSGDESLARCRRFWNHRVRGEGQFAALFRKKQDAAAEKEVDETSEKEVCSRRQSLKNRRGRMTDAGRGAGCMTDEMREFLSGCLLRVTEERLLFLDERVFLLPEHMPDLCGLRVVRSGLYLGDNKKNRFEPSQALAMALCPEKYRDKCMLEPGDARVEKYLRGETIQSEGEDGWTLVCAGQLPLGWGKRSRGTIKNKIAPGWRKS